MAKATAEVSPGPSEDIQIGAKQAALKQIAAMRQALSQLEKTVRGIKEAPNHGSRGKEPSRDKVRAASS